MIEPGESAASGEAIPQALSDDDPRLLRAAAWLTGARERLSKLDTDPVAETVTQAQLVRAIADAAAARPSSPPDEVRAAFARWCLQQHPTMSEADANYAYHHALTELDKQLSTGDDSPRARQARRRDARAELSRHVGHEPASAAPAPAPALRPVAPLTATVQQQAHAAVRAATRDATVSAQTPFERTRPAGVQRKPATSDAQQNLAQVRQARDAARTQLREQRARQGSTKVSEKA